ncbi:MAG: non-canonical purine NTP diphosphatase [Muribaculum sp.]|nr:non-canonical purine NTP diphosphatase [Muribaculum sp.]
MPQLVFATNNPHKLAEVREILAPTGYTILSLSEIGCTADIPETADTLEGNARLKAMYVKEHFGLDCFADDTGLEVDALGGAPGVYSARYAGPGHDSEANVALLLKNLENTDCRTARFRTVIALTRPDGSVVTLDGTIEGEITHSRHGEAGFGYDPVFRPEGRTTTFAQMSATDKNAISHRGRAVARLLEYLSSQPQ